MRIIPVLAVLALSGGAAAADAQSCLGIASFAAGPIRAEGSFTSGDGANLLGAGLAAGKARGPFAGVGINRIDVEESDESVTGFGLHAGWELELGTARPTTATRWSLCPIARFQQYRESFSDPDFDLDADVTVRGLSAGLALGTTIASSPNFALAPFGSLSLLRLSVDTEGLGEEFDDLLSDSETGGELDLGLGLIFNRMLTVRPMVMIPLGFEDSDAQFGISVHINFGRGR